MAIADHLSLLGYRVEDRVTGFRGVVTSVCFDLYGCIQAIVHPGCVKGVMKDPVWFDIARLRIVSGKRVLSMPKFLGTQAEIASGKKGPAEKPQGKY